MTNDLRETPRTKLKRFRTRGDFTRETVDAILDEGLICHLGFVVDDQPFVIPTAYGRIGDDVYLHGSAASRTLKAVGKGIPVCVTVTLTDGIVLARCAFNHSFNYRSVVLLGNATPVLDPDEKARGLEAFSERIVPGRWADIRWPTAKELKATTLLKLPIDEGSAKVRTGPPVDEGEDLELDAWAGVIPFETRVLDPIASPDMRPGIETPEYVARYQREVD